MGEERADGWWRHFHPCTWKFYFLSKAANEAMAEWKRSRRTPKMCMSPPHGGQTRTLFSLLLSWQTSGYFILEVIFICPLERPDQWLIFFLIASPPPLIIFVIPTHCKTCGNFKNRNKEMQSHTHTHTLIRMLTCLCVIFTYFWLVFWNTFLAEKICRTK